MAKENITPKTLPRGLLLLGLAVLLLGAAAPDYRAWVETRRDGEQLCLTAYATSARRQSCRYRLTALRSGPGGRASSTQGGKVDFSGDAAAKLATLKLSLHPAEKVRIRLQLYQGDELVFEQLLEEHGASPI